MKKSLNYINIFFLSTIILIFALVTYVFVRLSVDFSQYILFGITIVIIVVSFSTNIVIGLITSAVSVFGLGSYLLYNDIVENSINDRLSYLWLIIFPIAGFLAGSLGENINKLDSSVAYLQKKILKLITKDEITGFDNVREFYNELDEQISGAKRHKFDLSLMLIEIEYYSELKSIYGPSRAKQFLKLFSELITKTSREEDKRYKVQDNMFAIILPHTNLVGAERLKDRIKEAFSDFNVNDVDSNKTFTFDLKIGVFQYNETIRNSLEFKELSEKELEYDV